MFPPDVEKIDGRQDCYTYAAFCGTLGPKLDSFHPKKNLLTSFFMSSSMRSHTTRCGTCHTTICACCFEVDVPWERIPMPELTLAQYPDWTPNQPTSRETWGHCQRTRW